MRNLFYIGGLILIVIYGLLASYIFLYYRKVDWFFWTTQLIGTIGIISYGSALRMET